MADNPGSGQKGGGGGKQKVGPPSLPSNNEGGSGSGIKSKAELKAERRAKQEAQRAAKAAAKKEKPSPANEAAPRVPAHVMVDLEVVNKRVTKALERQHVPQRAAASTKAVPLFKHLHQYEKDSTLTQRIMLSSNSSIHPSFIRLGLQYAAGHIVGSNARCVALLAAMQRVIVDYTTPEHKDLSRDLYSKIKPYISFLKQCRPLSVSMGHAVKYMKRQISVVPPGTDDSKAKEMLLDSIDSYVKTNITLASERISELARDKIQSGDVIMIYAGSSLVYKCLKEAYESGISFKVVVVDSVPKVEGRAMLKRLLKLDIDCSYVFLNSASHVIQREKVTKVMLGAHTLLANGSIMSRVGSSQLALMARSFNVSVIVCCETYKFTERVQTDSIVFNELGDPDEIVSSSSPAHVASSSHAAVTDTVESPLTEWRDVDNLRLLNLLYDVTPANLVTMVITELGRLPCSSAPVVLRVKHQSI